MTTYILRKHKNKLYEVYVNGVKVKNAIYTGINDFKKDLVILGISGEVRIQDN